jgi:predicted PurR-regulated permease PerM
MIGLGAGVVGTIDNVLRPLILSGRTQMNGLVMFISLLGGVSVFGLLGLVLGPLIMALAAGLLDAYTYSTPVVTTPAPAEGGDPRVVR